MSRYYFAAIALPPLSFSDVPAMNFEAVMTLLQDNLAARDLVAINRLRRYYDLVNLRAVWSNLPLLPYGTMGLEQLQECSTCQTGLPEYGLDFLATYGSSEERLKHFPALLSAYYRHEGAASQGFLRQYLAFEHQWRLVAAAWRAKKLGRDLAQELRYEEDDECVATLLADKGMSSLEAQDSYKELQHLLDRHQDDPIALQQALCHYRCQAIEDMLGIDTLSEDRIIGYVAQLIALEQYSGIQRVQAKESI